MKKSVPVSGAKSGAGKVQVKKKTVSAKAVRDANLTDADCTCATMAPHCPIHSVRRIPSPGTDVIR